MGILILSNSRLVSATILLLREVLFGRKAVGLNLGSIFRVDFAI